MIKLYSKILLAVDGSEHSMRAAKEAVKVAMSGSNTEVEMVFVADFSKVKNEVLHTHGKEELEYSRRQRLQPVEELMKTNQIKYTLKILRGEPGPSIVEHANKGNFDLVVIGSRGLNSLQEMVLGSVSHKVVKRVSCPVLMVK